MIVNQLAGLCRFVSIAVLLLVGCLPGPAEPASQGVPRPEDEAIRAEVVEILDGKIKELRDYHQPVPAKAA